MKHLTIPAAYCRILNNQRTLSPNDIISYLIIALLVLFSGSTLLAQETKSTLRYNGSSTIAHFIQDAQEEYGKAKFNINTSGESEGGEKAIVEGLTDIAGVARIPEADITALGMNITLIGWDAIAVVVNENNPVGNLSQKQLKDIFTGVIRNWNEIGGPDLDIHPYIVGFESATRKVFHSVVLEEADYNNCTVSSPDVNILVDVKNDPGAIGQISFSFLGPHDFVKPIAIDGQAPELTNRDYPITRPLNLLWWNRKSVKDFVDWSVSPEGQAVVQKRFITVTGITDATNDLPLIHYTGSSTIGIFLQNASSVYRKAHFELNTEAESSGGEEAIVTGDTELAGIARLPQPSTLQSGVISTLIAHDAISVIVHENININNLTIAELKLIFTGGVTNWKELGGQDLPIIPFIVGSGSATNKVFKDHVLGVDAYSGCTEIHPDPSIIDTVAHRPGAIGQISSAFINPADHVHIVSVGGQYPSTTNLNYPISRPLYLLWKEGNPKIEAFVHWTQTPEAQQVIMQHFIGSQIVGTPTQSDETGVLIVYTETTPIEDGGVYFYPHLPYEIYSSDGELIKRVRNSLSLTDETPDRVELSSGSYLIRTEGRSGTQEEFFVTIEPGKVTKVNVEEINQIGFIATKDESLEKSKAIADVVSRFKSLQLYADFRLRGELDWDSRRSDGNYRTDRTRLRYRLRFGFNYKWNDHIAFGARIRSGDARDQQSPHITLGSEFEAPTVSIDKAFIKGTHGSFWWWGGKNDLPFWKQNELWWDDDVNPEGLALGSDFRIGERVRMKPTASYFIVYSRGRTFDLDPFIAAAQVVFDFGLNKAGITLATGFYNFHEMPSLSDNEGDFSINYANLNSGIKVDLKTKMPLSFGLDLMVNLTDYSADSLIVARDMQDQKTGYVVNVTLGKLQKKGDFLFAYYYSHIEKYSVVDYFAQDDWVRWGFNEGRGTRSSNFKGHEFRLAYAFGSGFNVVSRVYLINGIKKNHPNDVATETGNRFRVDFNIKF